MFCPECGANISDTAKFCSECGAALDSEPVSADTAVPSEAPAAAPSAAPSKKKLVTVICSAAAVIVVLCLVFFFACGALDNFARKDIVEKYLTALENEDPDTIAELYHPNIPKAEGYTSDEFAEFVDDEDPCFYIFGGEKIADRSIRIESMEEFLNSYVEVVFSNYDYYIGEGYTKDELEELKEETLRETDTMMEEVYALCRDYYDFEAQAIAFATVNASFEESGDETIMIALVKVSGKWYIISTIDEGMDDLMF